MQKKELYFYSPKNKEKRYGIIWYPDDKNNIKSIIHICHGMCERIGRYELFADYMTKKGFIVCGSDYEGHGLSTDKENFGHISYKDGYINIIKDIYKFQLIVKKINKNIPYFLLGHSMGSFLTRQYALVFRNSINGIILSGTRCSGLEVYAGLAVCNIMKLFRGERAKGRIILHFTDKIFNSFFQPNRTEYDWLSRDNNIVDDFINDCFCGCVFSYSAYINLLTVLKIINKKKWYKSIDKSLPFFIISGTDDPVGNFCIDVFKFYDNLIKSGCKNLYLKFYNNARHEVLNETNKYEVYKDISKWLDKIILLTGE